LHDKDIAGFDLESQPEAGKDAFDFSTRHVYAQHLVTARQAHADGLALGQVDDLVVDGADLAATDIDDEPGHALDVLGDGVEVDPALEAVAGFGTKLEAPGTTHDGFGPPEGGFQVDIGGVERDSRGFATHDAGEAFELVARGDDTYGRVKRDGLPVEQFKLFALLCPANSQPRSEEHTSELQSRENLVCRLLLEKKK